METIKQDIEELLLTNEQLKSEQLEKIDFDKLIQQLDKIHTLYENFVHVNSEFQQLKENLISKIKIMEKSTEVVRKKRPDIDEIKLKFEKLTSMNSLDLLHTFEKTETKFHAAFPSTFHLAYKNKNKVKDYSSYK